VIVIRFGKFISVFLSVLSFVNVEANNVETSELKLEDFNNVIKRCVRATVESIN